MNVHDLPTRRILVIANRTCPCPTLAEQVMLRGSGRLLDVLVVAPALNSRLRHWVSDVDGAVEHTRARLDLAVADLATHGLRAAGEVGDANPCTAQTLYSISRRTRS